MQGKSAVALAREAGIDAPLILAKGKGELAERILEIASDNGIPVIEDELLATILSEAEIGTCIPEETWLAVASIFAFLRKGIDAHWFR